MSTTTQELSKQQTKGASANKGTFGWYELMTTDPAAAKTFYSSVVGWTTADVGSSEMAYSTFNLGNAGVAGLMKLPRDAGPTPAWIGYIHVDNVDTYAKKVADAGGKIHKAPTDVPGMLRFSVVMDPQGAPFVLFTPDPKMPTPSNRPNPGDVGTVSWHELMATDGPKALDFYSKLFGFKPTTSMDMGPMGQYQMFASEGEQAIGGIMTKPPEAPSPFWNYYIQVDNITAARDRVKKGGGSILREPQEVPGGQWILQAKDPQGAFFCLVSNNK